MNKVLLKGILLVIISISLFLTITGDFAPANLLVLGLAIVCWSLMPKIPR